MEHFISLCNIDKVYNPGENQVEALKGISLDINAGEFVAIIGSSGSGKSTLMNLLGCLDLPDRGKYFLDGRDLSQANDQDLSEIRNRKIGFIFQGFNLIQSLTAIENVELPLAYRGVPRSERRRMAAIAMTDVGLEGRTHHLPAQLSGGQQQRVAIARAIAGNPPLILADEPTGNLDSKSGKAVMDLLFALHREGKTIILITHDPSIAALSPRVLKISDGELISDTQREASGA